MHIVIIIITIMSCTLTIVLALYESLPFTEPMHAYAVDDHGGLLLLKCLVQLNKERNTHTHEKGREREREI